MDPMMLMSLLGGASAGGGGSAGAGLLGQVSPLLQTGMGLWQLFKGNGMNVPRPVESIPQAATNALDVRAGLATQGLPGKSAIESQMGADISSAASHIGGTSDSPAAAAAAIAGLYGNKMGQSRQLGVQDAQQRIINQQNYAQGLDQYAGWQDKIWDWNNKQKYIEDEAKKEALQGTGLQNIMGGVKTGVGTGLQTMGSSKYMDELNRYLALLGGQGNVNPGFSGGNAPHPVEQSPAAGMTEGGFTGGSKWYNW